MNGDHIKEVFNQYSATLIKISTVMLGNESDANDAVQETFLKYMISKLYEISKSIKETTDQKAVRCELFSTFISSRYVCDYDQY